MARAATRRYSLRLPSPWAEEYRDHTEAVDEVWYGEQEKTERGLRKKKKKKKDSFNRGSKDEKEKGRKKNNAYRCETTRFEFDPCMGVHRMCLGPWSEDTPGDMAGGRGRPFSGTLVQPGKVGKKRKKHGRRETQR